MKKIFMIILLTHINVLYANINIVTSIAPLKTFIQEIAKDKANIAIMVKAGSSPHTYEPKPSQMININNAKLYFAIGVEFENVWLDKFINQNNSMQIVNLSANIPKLSSSKHGHGHEHQDPHIWTSPNNVKQISLNILNSLIKIDKKNSIFYTNNYIKFIKKINITDSKIKSILQNTNNNNKFMVFHPSWTYFANEYNLIQSPIEIEGKSPKPRELIKILKYAKKHSINAIIVSPEFSNKIVQQIAQTLDIKVIKISPLNPNWSNNLIKLAKTVATK